MSETQIPQIVTSPSIRPMDTISVSFDAYTFDDFMDTIIFEYALKDGQLPVGIFYYCEDFKSLA